MESLAFLVCGAAASAVLWLLVRPTFAQPLFERANFRGRTVPVGAGIVLVLACFAVSAVLVVAGRRATAGEVFVAVATAAAFGLLGLLDDLAAQGDDKGFRGHVGALAHGRLTTGGIKLFGGAAVGVVVAASAPGANLVDVLVGGAVVALAANLANLLDRAPGRTTKIGLVAFLVLLAIGPDDPGLRGVGLVVGGAVGLLWPDLREQLMLGDAGANPLGAALGLGVVLTTGLGVQVGVLLVLLALNVLSEKVSFSRVIDRTPPLRALDRLGRQPD